MLMFSPVLGTIGILGAALALCLIALVMMRFNRPHVCRCNDVPDYFEPVRGPEGACCPKCYRKIEA